MIPLNEQAYRHLQHMILTDQLSYQEIYSETKLSKELGISRTPFRDAIHRLALECYCTFQITQAYHSRSAKKLFRELDFLMECLKEILDTTKSIEEFCEYDFQFHTRIIEYLDNKQFASVFAAFMYRMRRLAALSLSHKGRMEDTYQEHMAILDAMKRGDTEHIYEITLKHMEIPRGINLEDL